MVIEVKILFRINIKETSLTNKQTDEYKERRQ